MENIALTQLGQLVYNYCGLNYLSNLPSLEAKVSKRLQELNVTLWSYIKILEESAEEWDVLMVLLTINETYFYREDKQLSVFQHTVLPSLNKKHVKPIKIWSAACSTGEEPYSLAMSVLDSGIYSSDEVQIIGTDINKKVLNTAKGGTYNKRSLSFRRIPERWLTSYFYDNPNDYQIKGEAKEMVSFKYLNLLDDRSMRSESGYDVIFCRNVLIYFDAETIKKVATYFYHSLKKDGLLFLGHAENISNMGIGFETISTDGTFYYRKG
ncbi:CheR family methyltransferase [Bacillus pinisoli]|uniref:CheR family methyltransferase n=1 Tax=Bacillus pinisoli TaxID=2901866 RepID=UPI001FF3D83F|nr:protein-glutamate O-methyltransferase CheR [Bacillus pinisoli]